MRICRECGRRKAEIVGTGTYGDTIEVECTHCGEFYEVEVDGFGEGGLEFIEALMMTDDDPLDFSVYI